MATTENNDVINHGINAAQETADDSQSKEQVKQLSSELNGANASSQVNNEQSQQ